MTATEARNKAEDFLLNSGKNDLSGILSTIRNTAESGRTSCSWELPNREELSGQIRRKLEELGYTVQHRGCKQGVTEYVVFW